MNKNTKMNIKLILTFIVLVLFSTSVYINAQVTIGNISEPSHGALLDIKEKTGETADKGLLLPRVALKKEKSLIPVLTTTGAVNVDSIAYHVGLTVYNMTTNAYFCPGVYTWTGTRWEEVHRMDGKIIKGDAESNSFIVPPLTGIDIPVKKAYDVWKNYKQGQSSLAPFETNGAKDLSTLTPGKLGAILVWQDVPYMIKNASEVDNTLYLLNETTGVRETAVIGTGENAIIRVLPRLSKCNEGAGNAVIALTIDGDIYWTWHIWFTNYDPNTSIPPTAPGRYDVTNGKIYLHNNSTIGGDYVFMDRDLGALSSTPGDDKAIGLVYQWGRKDAFPGAESFTKTGYGDYKPIYDAINGDTPLPPYGDKSGGGIYPDYPPGFGLSYPNLLALALQNPKWLIYGADNDWFTGVRKSDMSASSSYGYQPYQVESYQNLFLWDENGKKTVFDPCPKGWRVPALKGQMRPWFSQEARFAGGEVFAPNPATMLGLPASAWNYGWDFDQATFSGDFYIGGYYPASGYIYWGDLEEVGQTSYSHTANPQIDNSGNSSGFRITKDRLYFISNEARHSAEPVRCVQETK